MSIKSRPDRLTRHGFLVGCASAVGALVAACASSTASTPTTAPSTGKSTAATSAAPAAAATPASKAKVNLVMSVRQGAEGSKPQDGLNAFMKANPNIGTTLQTFPGNQYQAKILTLGAGGHLPDVIYTNVGFYGLFANNGFLAELDPIIKQKSFDMSQYYQVDLDGLKWKGKLHALPWKGHPGNSAIWYDKEMFGKANIDATSIKDYDSLVSVAQKLTKDTNGVGKTNQWGWLNAGYDGWSLIGHFIAFGGDEVTPIYGATKAQLDQPKQTAAITWLYNTLHEWKICPLPSGEDYSKIFISGDAAMQNGALVMSGNQAAIGSRFTQEVVSMPKGPGGSISSWHNNDQMALNAKTTHPDEAWVLLAYMCGKEMGIRLGLSQGGGSATPGARRDVYNSPELQKVVPSIKMFAQQMEDAKAMWWAANLQTSKVWDTIGQGLQKIMLSSKPPTDADFHELNSLAQSVLDEPMP